MSEDRQNACEEKIDKFNEEIEEINFGDLMKSREGNDSDDEEDIKPEISSGDQIQLESFKSIPEFSG